MRGWQLRLLPVVPRVVAVPIVPMVPTDEMEC